MSLSEFVFGLQLQKMLSKYHMFRSPLNSPSQVLRLDLTTMYEHIKSTIYLVFSFVVETIKIGLLCSRTQCTQVVQQDNLIIFTSNYL